MKIKFKNKKKAYLQDRKVYGNFESSTDGVTTKETTSIIIYNI